VSETVVRVAGLRHAYMVGTPMETAALRGAELTVSRGEIAALVGPDGAGKSTLLRFLNALLRPARMGQVTVLGSDAAAPSLDVAALRRRVGLVFQYPHHQLFERYVGDDVAYGARQLGLSAPEVRERVAWAMAAVGLDLDAFKDRATFSLSGGEMRRAALAGVLAMKPELLLLDEATTGLDPGGRSELHTLLRRLRDLEGMTVVLASNDMDEVAELADSVTVLQGGRTVAAGPVRDVFYSADGLQAVGLTQPSTVGIVGALRERGFALPGEPLTLAEVEEGIWRALPA